MTTTTTTTTTTTLPTRSLPLKLWMEIGGRLGGWMTTQVAEGSSRRRDASRALGMFFFIFFLFKKILLVLDSCHLRVETTGAAGEENR